MKSQGDPVQAEVSAFGGVVMSERIEPKDLKVGQRVTVLRWLQGGDRSYVGSVLKIMAVDLPFVVFREELCRYGFRGVHSDDDAATSLRISDVEFGTISDEYVAAMTKRRDHVPAEPIDQR
jgi:hypothetical protein